MKSQNQQTSYGQIPLSFIANTGQTDPNVKFQVKGAGHSIYFTPNEITFTAFQKPNEPGNQATTSSIVRSSLANSNPNPTISGLEQLPGFANFILGEDSSQWQTNVPTFNGVVYQNVYQGIDRVFKGTEGQLKSEFLVAPFANPSQIKMNYTGVNDIRLRDDGALILETPLGELIDNAPIVYQDINRQRVNVPAAYNLLGNGQVGFSLGEFDRTQPLVIDPVLAYSTYLGGSASDSANRIAVDSTGAAYIIGTTVNNFTTTPGAYQTTPAGQADFLVTKINSEGTALVYSTYIGGTGNEYGIGIAVDGQGNAYLTGQVDPGYPTTPGSFQPTATTYNAAATKLNAAGNSLVYSTFLGGNGSALGTSIAVDSNGNAYVTGPTGDNFPIANASQPQIGGNIDAFITKVNPTGSGLVYSTYFGGSNRDEGQGIAVDSNGNAYVSGITYSTNLPLTNPVQTTIGGGQYDAFISKFTPNGARIYSTYLGGTGDDQGTSIAADSSGNAYIVGTTSSTNFPTLSPIQLLNAGGANDAFVSKLSAAGNSLIYSTYLGGSGDDKGDRITVDSAGNAYVTGNTTSTNFPTKNAIQSISGGGQDAFITSINSSGSTLVDSTYLGGSGDDNGGGIAVDANGAVYVAGSTTSTNFPTANPLQAANGGGASDAFITKIIPGGPQVRIVESGGSTNVAESGTTDTYTVVLTNQPTADVAIALNTGTQIQSIAGLSFTPTNWFVPQTVTVSAVDDTVAETSPHTGTITHAATSTDAKYNGANASFTVNGTASNTVNANITDNDIAGVSITPITANATEGGANGSYSVKLNTQPIAPVTINLATDSQIQPITALTFTPNNWNVAQTVQVKAVDDSLVEGNHTSAIAHSSTSSDVNYNGITILPVNVAITDNDTAGVSITPTSTTATEGGATGSYTVQLNTQPTAPVTINLATDSQIQPITALTFTAANWNTPQTVTVKAVDDNLVEGNHTGAIAHTVTSTDVKYNSITISPVNVTIVDNDTAGVSINPTTATATEGGANGSYSVRLNTQPTAPVTINLATGTQIQPITALTFTSANWNVDQTVAVKAVDDNLVEGNHAGAIAHSSTSSDVKYNSITILPVNVAITDNDTAPISPTPINPTPIPIIPITTPITTLIPKPPTPEPPTPIPTPIPIFPTPGPTTSITTPITTPITTLIPIFPIPKSPTPTPTPTPTPPTPTPPTTKADDPIWCGLEPGLNQLNSIVNSQLRKTKLPILGRLSDVSPDFFGDFKSNLINAVKNASDFNPNQLQKTIQNALGSDFSVRVSGNSSTDDNNLQITVGKAYKLDNVTLADDLGLPGLGLKVKQLPKKKVDIAKVFNPRVLQSIQSVNPDSNSNSELEILDDTSNNLEILNPELNSLKVASNLSSQLQRALPKNLTDLLATTTFNKARFIDYELSLGIGVNKDFGCYIDTDRTKVKADMNFRIPETFQAKADLGLLEAEFQNDSQNPTEVKGSFEVKLKDLDNLGGADDGNRLTLSELNGKYQLKDLFQSNASAKANLGLNAKTSINGNSAIPSYTFDLAASWPEINYQNGELQTQRRFTSPTSQVLANTSLFDNLISAKSTEISESINTSNPDNSFSLPLDLSNSKTAKSNDFTSLTTFPNLANIATPLFTTNPFAGLPAPIVDFNNVKLDLGTFVSNFAKPVLGKVSDIISPFRPVINFLNADTKLLSALGIAKPFDKNRDGKVTVLELASTLSGGSLVTGFLDAVVQIDSVSQLASRIANTPGNLGIDMGSYRLRNLDVSQKTSSLKDASYFAKDIVPNIGQQINSTTGGITKQFLNAFPSITGLEVPLLKNPATAIDLLLGKDPALFTYDMPPLGFDFNISQKFPIWGPISGLIAGNLKGSADLAFGYDTVGLKQWKNDKFVPDSAYKVLDGFYVSDRANPDGTGPDVDELKLNASIAVGLGLNVVLASAYVKGGIEGIIGIDLVDFGENNGTSDGKIRGSEIASRISTPWKLFDVSGQINAFLGAEVNVFLLGKVYDKRFATFRLASFGNGESSGQVGTVTNSYLTGAKVFFDGNFNGIQDEKEPFTISNADGSFDLDVSLPEFDKNNNGELEADEGRLVVTDGINTATYLPQQTPLTATPDATVVTPLTTLMQKMVAQGINPNEAETKVKAAFGVPSTIDLTSYDPLQAITQNDPNGLAVYAAHIQIQNVIVQTTILISGISANSIIDIADRTISTIANQIQAGTVDLTNSAQLQTIIQSTANQVQSQKASDLAPEVAKILAEGNQRVKAIASSNLPLADAATKIAQIQQVEQGEVAKDLQQVATGNKTIQEAIAENTGASLDAQIQSSTVKDPTIRNSIDSNFSQESFPEGGIELVNNSPDQKIGNDGDDTLNGDSSDDVLSGKKGNDLIFGFNGNDWINGNQNNDLIDGGLGDDTLYGGKGIDTITGSDGSDIIFGNQGDDILDGGTGNDTLRGGKGSDLITGGDGDDFLFGETGSDTLTGGAGNDQFLLSANSSIDVILDFEDGKDLLSVGNGLTFSQLSITQENSSTFIRLSATGEILASLNGVSASLINAANFRFA